MAKGSNPPRKPASKADKESKLFISLARKGENAKVKEILKASPPADLAGIKSRVRARLREDDAGRITYGAWANAIKGRVPG